MKIVYLKTLCTSWAELSRPKEKDKALEFYNALVEQDPKTLVFLNSIGICYKEMGKFEDSISSYNLALK